MPTQNRPVTLYVCWEFAGLTGLRVLGVRWRDRVSRMREQQPHKTTPQIAKWRFWLTIPLLLSVAIYALDAGLTDHWIVAITLGVFDLLLLLSMRSRWGEWHGGSEPPNAASH